MNTDFFNNNIYHQLNHNTRNVDLFFDAFPKKHNLTPIKITDVKNNRNLLKTYGYKKAGIYVWLTPDGKMYVGRSINLYERVRSYFYKTPKYKGVSLIRNYFNKYGFAKTCLILFLLPNEYAFNELVTLAFARAKGAEQAFLDFLKPTLNLDKKATPTRYNGPMPSETYDQFIKQRSHSVAGFSTNKNQLLWVFKSKQECTTLMGLSHSTLNTCINTNKTYLKSFKFSILNNSASPALKNLTIFLDLVKQKCKLFESYKHRNKKAQKIYAQHISDSTLSWVFESQRDCATYLPFALAKAREADRETIRTYLNNPKKGYFRKIWKLTII